MAFMAWLVVYIVLAIAFTIYHRRWMTDYQRQTGAKDPLGFTAFILRRVDDPALEVRRRIGAVFAVGMIALGVGGLLVPLK